MPHCTPPNTIIKKHAFENYDFSVLTEASLLSFCLQSNVIKNWQKLCLGYFSKEEI
jgi:hypothetical protein